MKRILFTIILSVIALLAHAQEVKVDITVSLSRDGSAVIRELWSLDIDEGTEWYLVRDNLGDIKVKNLSVHDETGIQYENEGSWDVNRSMAQKAGKCGIVSKSNGVEICWGLGDHNPHKYTVQYTMTNVVKSMQDYDALHMQFVSPGIRPRVSEASVTILAEGQSLNDENTGIWAFGYEGDVVFNNGTILATTDHAFHSDEYSMIVLARFDKGMFNSPSVIDEPFQNKLETAFYGSTYEEYLRQQKAEKRAATLFAVFATLFSVLAVIGVRNSVRKRNRNIFGVDSLKEIGYERDLPFDGDILSSRYILGKVGRHADESRTASAMILRMINNGQILISYDSKQRPLLSFNENADLSGLDESSLKLYEMMKQASGSDLILQNKEFSRWSDKHSKTVSSWVSDLSTTGLNRIMDKGYVREGSYSPEGQLNARRVIGFQKYLKDFTIMGERKASDVALWQDYIVMAALYGIADKVAKELKDIDPKAFEEALGYPYPVFNTVIHTSNHMGASILNTVYKQTSSSVSGHGGHASFGGGGGFSGGGFGGGAR